MVKLANKTLGYCMGCSILIEQGDWYDPATRTHTGCRVMDLPEAPDFALTSPLLFDDPIRAEDERAKEKVGAVNLAIHGPTYNKNLDKRRITKHLLAIFDLMEDREYRSTAEIATAVECAETTAAARIRQLRAMGHDVPKRWVKGGEGAPGHWEYALIVNRSLLGGVWEINDESRAA